MYSLFEYNKAGHMRVVREEGREEGISIGEKRGESKERTRIIANMISRGRSIEEIAELCGCTEEEIQEVIDNGVIKLK